MKQRCGLSILRLRVYPVTRNVCPRPAWHVASVARRSRGTPLAWHAEQMSRTRQPGLLLGELRDSFGGPARRTSTADGDPGTAWRRENANAAVRFLTASAARKDS